MPPSVPVPPCSHPKREFLGTDWPAEFYRCEECGVVLIVQGRRVWQVPSGSERPVRLDLPGAPRLLQATPGLA